MIIAFDCFDTLITRDCHPEQVLYTWAKRMHLLLGLQLIPLKLYEMRKKSEIVNKEKMSKEEISYADLMSEVYKQLVQLECIEISEKDFIEFSFKNELEIELQHISLVHSAIEKLEYYSSRGNPIILISDFYLGNVFFEEILSHLKIKNYFEKIYISSELSMRKSTGTLYEHVLKDLNITPEQLMMIGDNPISDIDIPRKIGINTSLVKKNNNHNIYTKSKLNRKLNYLLKCTSEDKLFYGYVPALLLFIDSLYKTAILEKCNVLLFCSREGQNLKKLFDIYQKKVVGKTMIQTKYFYVSRKSTLNPSLKDINSEDFSRIFRQYKNISLHDFLYSIGFDEDEIKLWCNELNLDEELAVSKENIQAELHLLFSNKSFIELYNSKRHFQRELFEKYVNELVGAYDNTLHLVDIGWKGTIQDNIYEILKGKKNIIGYYFGLSQKLENENNKKRGLVFDCEPKSYYYDIYSYNSVELERVFAANHGQTLSYDEINGKVIPILSKERTDVDIYEYIKRWQDSMNEVFSFSLDLFNASPFLPEDISEYLTKLYLRHLCKYEPKYYYIYLEFRKKYKENFGTVSGRYNYNKAELDSNHWIKKKYGYSDYSYRILDKYHLKFFKPLASIYCNFIYVIKSERIKKAGS